MASKRGSTSFMIVILIAVMLIAGAVTTAVIMGDGGATSNADSPDLFLVRKGSFDVTIPTSGELAAMRQVEIRNLMEEEGVIMEIVPEGTFVAEGTVLLKLNDEAMVEEIQDEQESVNDAQNRFDNAVSNLSITKKDRESQLAQAELQIELARLALEAWEKGEEKARRTELRIAIETNQKDYDRAQERYDKSIELEAKQFISTDELKGDEISMIKAKAALERAQLDLEVYENYTYFQDKAQTESDLKQAQDEAERTKEKMDAEVRSAESDLATSETQLKSRNERLTRLEEQMAYTVLTAPTEGLVVYASSLRQGRDGRNEGRPPDVGTEIRRNELVMVIPDTSQMVAEVKVNETRTGQIRPGQRVTVTSDARPDQSMTGRVLSVGVLAASGGWRDPNRRDYTVRVRLDTDGIEGLKPSMRCNAVIFVDRVENVTYVPVSAVGQKGRVSYVWVPDGGGFSQREIKYGRSSELYVEVLEGLEPGELVLLREPRVDEIVTALDIPDEELVDPFAGDEGPLDGGPDGTMPNLQMEGSTPVGMPEGFQPTPEQLEQFRRTRDGGGGNTGRGGGGRGRGGAGGGGGGGGGGRGRGGGGGDRGGNESGADDDNSSSADAPQPAAQL